MFIFFCCKKIVLETSAASWESVNSLFRAKKSITFFFLETSGKESLNSKRSNKSTKRVKKLFGIVD